MKNTNHFSSWEKIFSQLEKCFYMNQNLTFTPPITVKPGIW